VELYLFSPICFPVIVLKQAQVLYRLLFLRPSSPLILRCKMTLTSYTSFNNHTYRISLYGVINVAGLCVSVLGLYRFEQVHFIRSKFIGLFIKMTSFQNLTVDHVQI